MSSQLWENLSGTVLDGRYRLEALTYSGRNQAEFHGIAGEPVTVTLVAVRPEEIEQFSSELLHASRLQHPNLLRIIHVGRWINEGRPFLYLVTEPTDETLAGVLRAGPLSPSTAGELASDVIAALAFLHDQGLVYRSLEPQTTVRSGARWKLADFGQLCPIGARGAAVLASAHNPPEAGTDCVLQSWDVWALGALLREALGQGGPDPIPAPAAFRAIIERCLDSVPGRRPSLEEIHTMLRSESTGSSVGQAEVDAVSDERTAEPLSRTPPAPAASSDVPRRPQAASIPKDNGTTIKRWRMYVAVTALILGVITLLLVFSYGREPGRDGRSEKISSTTHETAKLRPEVRAYATPPAPGWDESRKVERPSPMIAGAGASGISRRRGQAIDGQILPSHESQPRTSPRETGIADYISSSMDGQRTASGVPLDSRALTAAHPSYALGTRLRVTNLENERSVIVRVNDRGRFSGGRVIHLTERAARDLGLTQKGWARVRIERVE